MTDREAITAVFKAIATLHQRLIGEPLVVEVSTDKGTVLISETGDAMVEALREALEPLARHDGEHFEASHITRAHVKAARAALNREGNAA